MTGCSPTVSVLERIGETPDRVAVFRAGQLGDMLVAVPALRTLRRALPRAEVILIGLPWAAQLAQRLPELIDRFLEFPSFPGIVELPLDPPRLLRFLTETHRRRFDLALQMHGGGGYSNPFTLLLNARHSAGFVSEHDTSGIEFRLPYVSERHEVLRFLDFIEFVTGLRGDPTLEFPLLPADREEAAALGLGAPGSYLVVHPGSRVQSRQWPAERFAAVAEAAADRLGLRVAVTGSAQERRLADAVITRLSRPAINLSGRTSLGGLAAVLANAALYVGNDTGAAHLANAVGTRSVIVYGSADLANWQPLPPDRHRTFFTPLACRPTRCTSCPYAYHCLTSIEAADVLAGLLDLIGVSDPYPLPVDTSRSRAASNTSETDTSATKDTA